VRRVASRCSPGYVSIGEALGRALPLDETLEAIGCQHRRAEFPAGAHDVLDMADGVLFTGKAFEVWEWLRREAKTQDEGDRDAHG